MDRYGKLLRESLLAARMAGIGSANSGPSLARTQDRIENIPGDHAARREIAKVLRDAKALVKEVN
jgi:hypothetical protein